MTKNEAKKLLDRLREGYSMPVALTTQALYATGDISRLSGQSLCVDGHEPCDHQPCQAHDQTFDQRFSYSQYLNCPTTESAT